MNGHKGSSDSQQEKHEYLYWEFKPRQQAVRMGPWKGYRGRIDEGIVPEGRHGLGVFLQSNKKG